MPRRLIYPVFERTGPNDEENETLHSQYNINYRQMTPGVPQPATTSSSYDYWWPYPPGGVSTTSNPSITPTLYVDPFSIATFSSLSLVAPGVSSSSTGSVVTSTTTSTSLTSIATSTISSSQSIITINATISSDPVSSTFSSYPKIPQNQGQNSATSKAEVYLIPTFVVLGVILGSIVAWIGWGCLTRKPRVRDFDDGSDAFCKKNSGRRPRRSELEVGPAYCPSLSQKRDYSEEAEDKPQSFSWRALDADGRKDSSTPERDYLVPPALPAKKSRTKSAGPSKRQQGLSRAATSKTATSVSVYSQVGEEDDYEEQESDRMSFLNEFESDYDPRSPRLDSKCSSHATPTSSSKSSRVVSVSRRRPNHTRIDSDSHLEDVEVSGKRVRDKKGDLIRSATARTQSSTHTTQTGFHMMDGSPLPTPAASSTGEGRGFFWGNNEPENREAIPKAKYRARSKSNATTVASDSYTALPARGSRSRSNSPVKFSSQTTKQRHVSARDQAIEQYYGNGFPQSPPQVTSPKLESSLCFTPQLN